MYACNNFVKASGTVAAADMSDAYPATPTLTINCTNLNFVTIGIAATVKGITYKILGSLGTTIVDEVLEAETAIAAGSQEIYNFWSPGVDSIQVYAKNTTGGQTGKAAFEWSAERRY